ncbi:hypothetical protein JAAARDRAFT_673701 [Jaapia argillacea MUCL 33604]|uniref:SANT domain-containing protein n=1 Tax=Jaapia argillacea MUCL 33604 TaxID=933084 RepID=A0A067PXJ3_9AGAM|nr:hypothetical protein JAAARDRAFT_673701 [Jaapia argillacea MUCL 33604]
MTSRNDLYTGQKNLPFSYERPINHPPLPDSRSPESSRAYRPYDRYAPEASSSSYRDDQLGSSRQSTWSAAPYYSRSPSPERYEPRTPATPADPWGRSAWRTQEYAWPERRRRDTMAETMAERMFEPSESWKQTHAPSRGRPEMKPPTNRYYPDYVDRDVRDISPARSRHDSYHSDSRPRPSVGQRGYLPPRGDSYRPSYDDTGVWDSARSTTRSDPPRYLPSPPTTTGSFRRDSRPSYPSHSATGAYWDDPVSPPARERSFVAPSPPRAYVSPVQQHRYDMLPQEAGSYRSFSNPAHPFTPRRPPLSPVDSTPPSSQKRRRSRSSSPASKRRRSRSQSSSIASTPRSQRSEANSHNLPENDHVPSSPLVMHEQQGSLAATGDARSSTKDVDVPAKPPTEGRVSTDVPPVLLSPTNFIKSSLVSPPPTPLETVEVVQLHQGANDASSESISAENLTAERVDATRPQETVSAPPVMPTEVSSEKVAVPSSTVDQLSRATIMSVVPKTLDEDATMDLGLSGQPQILQPASVDNAKSHPSEASGEPGVALVMSPDHHEVQRQTEGTEPEPLSNSSVNNIPAADAQATRMSNAQSLAEALRLIVKTRSICDRQTRADRVEPVLLANSTIAEPPPSSSESTSPDSVIHLIAEGKRMRARMNVFTEIAPTLRSRLALKEEDRLEKIRRLRQEYLALDELWQESCSRLERQAKSSALEEAGTASGRTTRRSAASMGDAVRSDFEMEQIIASLGNEDLTDANHLAMRNAAKIPDMISVTNGQVDYLYDDTNNLVEDPQEFYAPRTGFDDWTDEEKQTMLEMFAAHPKQFGIIADHLPNKTTSQCVAYYYLHKKGQIDFRKAITRYGAGKKKRGKKGGAGKGKGNALLTDIRQHDAEVSQDTRASNGSTRPKRGTTTGDPRKTVVSRRQGASLADSPTSTPTPDPEPEPRQRPRRTKGSNRGTSVNEREDGDEDG